MGYNTSNDYQGAVPSEYSAVQDESIPTIDLGELHSGSAANPKN
jgi:hypothetical protein